MQTVTPRVLPTFIISFAIFVALTTAWSLASPLMSGPDEHSHSIRAAGAAFGAISGTIVPGEDGFRGFMVPGAYDQLPNLMCYVLNSNITAGCATDVDSGDGGLVQVLSAAGTYNPLYYVLTGWPVQFLPNESGMYAMRLVSGVLNSFFLASGVTALLMRRARGWSLMAAVVAISPMVLFLSSVINPTSLEVSGSFALVCWLILLTSDTERRHGHVLPVVMVAISAIVVLNMRSVAPVWVLVILAAMLIDTRVWSRLLKSAWFWASTVAIGAGAAFAGWWTLTQGATEARDPEGTDDLTLHQAIEYMLSRTFENTSGYVGVFGWLDAKVPDTIISLWAGLMLLFIAAAILLGTRIWQLKTIALAAAVVLAPALIQGFSWENTGYIWQGRYLLGILVPLIVLAGATLDESVPQPAELRRGKGVVVTLGAALALMQGFSFLWGLRRYIIGLNLDSQPWQNMIDAPQWFAPPFGWYPLTMGYFTVLGIALILVLRIALQTPTPAVLASTGAVTQTPAGEPARAPRE